MDPKKPNFGARERDLVLRVATRFLRDDDQAQDAAQDAMLRAFRHLASFRGDCRFTTWLYRVAATTALMHLRKRRREQRHVNIADDDERYGRAHAPELGPEDRLIVEEELARMAGRLSRMGRRSGTIVRMRFAEGYSVVEIGKALGVNAGTVKSRAYRGRAALRAAAAD